MFYPLIIAPFIDIPMFNIKYLAMHKVQMQAGVISKLLYGFASVQAIIHSLKLAEYLLVQTHKPYNNFCLLHIRNVFNQGKFNRRQCCKQALFDFDANNFTDFN